MGIFNFFVDYRRATLTLFAIIMLYGYFAYRQIAIESDPEIKIPLIYVNVIQDGISAEDSVNLLAQPLEIAIRSLANIKQITTYAQEGSAVIIAEFQAGFSADKALDDVRNKVDENTNKLPQEAKKPIIKQLDLSLVPILNIILSGELEVEELNRIALNLKKQLQKIKEIREVTITAQREKVARILIEPEQLSKKKITIASLLSNIGANNKLLTLGSMRNKTAEFPVKLPLIIQSPVELLNFVVFSDINTKASVRLGDIAKVQDGFKDPKVIARSNGQNAIGISIAKQSGSNIIETIEKARQIVDEQAKYLPETLKITFANDRSDTIKESVADLENGIILAAILVMILVVSSISLKAAILVMLSLPMSFLATILLLYLNNLTLNIVVLFSLILTVGMVIDDAIVVSEYADRKMLEGVAPREAYLIAVHRMLWPIVAGTSTKIVVFLPLLFWPGVIGQFMRYMPITVLTIMSMSLLFALFFQPALGAVFFSKPPQISPEEREAMLASEQGSLEHLKGLSKRYVELLQIAINKPKMVIFSTIGMILLIFVSFGLFGRGLEFFPNIEADNVSIVVRAAGNLSLSAKEKLIHEVEQKLDGFKDEFRNYYATIGEVSRTNSDLAEDSIALINVELRNWQHRRKAHLIVDSMKRELATIPALVIETIAQQPGPKSAKPINIDIWANNYKDMEQFAKKMVNFLTNLDGIEDVVDSLPKSKLEYRLVVDRNALAQHGLTSSDIGAYVQLLTVGYRISTYRQSWYDDEIDIVVQLPQYYRFASMLNRLKIISPQGNLLPLNNFVHAELQPSVSQIQRFNGNNVVNIKAGVKFGYLANERLDILKKWLYTNNQSQMVNYQILGDDEKQQESSSFLKKAFIGAISLMFMIILLQFNSFFYSFVTMSAVFLSTAGVVLGLLIAGQAFGVVMCGIGIIALAGIVLNNNIIFIDTYKKLREEGFLAEKAVLMTGAQRLRPILLTAVTAILGLLPLVLGVTIDFFQRSMTYDSPSSQWWRQLSASIAGGLSFATILTLFFTPCLLILGNNFTKHENKDV